MNQIELAHHIYNQMPRGWDKSILPSLYEQGLIPKEKLIHGQLYQGYCRNSSEAVWDEPTQEFIYQRTKFNSTFPESIKHPEDDNGFDIFIPVTQL